jgi:hypothetical protein
LFLERKNTTARPIHGHYYLPCIRAPVAQAKTVLRELGSAEGCTRLLPCNICTLTTAAHNSDSKSSHAFHFLATAHLATQTSGKEGEGFQKLLFSSGHICRENATKWSLALVSRKGATDPISCSTIFTRCDLLYTIASTVSCSASGEKLSPLSESEIT